MPSALETLVKILKLEQETGYKEITVYKMKWEESKNFH